SSALDYRTDADLRLALRKNYSDVTSILIASRVSSIAHCTQILVMDEGRVIGQGTHQELLKSCPVYADIARTQMGGGLSA
ncbi:MAG: ABC transporter ATP-binding protein, partial [Clostridia bacterium]|nr:ABC transporter ATP-binding protein [Clostridia bacterium]